MSKRVDLTEAAGHIIDALNLLVATNAPDSIVVVLGGALDHIDYLIEEGVFE